MSRGGKINPENGLTLKSERMAQRYYVHGNPSQAYSEAYPDSKMKGRNLAIEAWRTMQHPAFQVYIKKLRQQDEDRVPYDKDQFLAECHDAYLLAKKLHDPKGMVAAATAKAKAEGLIIEKREHTHRNLKDMSDDDLHRQLAETEAELAAVRDPGNKEGTPAPGTRQARPGGTAGKPQTLQ